MKKENNLLSLIIPTYNESKNIALLIPNLVKLFEEDKIQFEIIVVDDDSPDYTWKVVKEFSEADNRISCIRRVTEKGLSSAVVTGMASAKGSFFGVMDADLQHDERIIPQMLEKLQNCDIVIGSRKVKDGSYGEMSFIRRFISKGATLVAKIFLPIQITDPMSGFFIVKKEVIDEVLHELNPLGFKILLEIIGRKKNIRAAEVGYKFRKRNYGETKLNASVIQNYLIALWDIRFGKIFPVRFLQYCIVGGLGVFINLLGQYFSSEVFGWKLEKTNPEITLKPSLSIFFGFELSVLFNYILNNYWTFGDLKNQGFISNLFGFLKFNTISIIGFIIQISIWSFSLSLWLDYNSNFLFEYRTYICNLLGIIFATIGNYYLNKNFTWSKT